MRSTPKREWKNHESFNSFSHFLQTQISKHEGKSDAVSNSSDSEHKQASILEPMSHSLPIKGEARERSIIWGTVCLYEQARMILMRN